MNVTEQELMTPGEVAEALNVSRTTIWRWRKSGTGPAFIQFQTGSVRYLPLKITNQVAQK